VGVELIRKWPWPGEKECEEIGKDGKRQCRFFRTEIRDNDHCSPTFFIRCSNPSVERILKDAPGLPNDAADVIISKHDELSYLLLAMCKLCRFRGEPEVKI
jgi:hypothetical protein